VKFETFMGRIRPLQQLKPKTALDAAGEVY